MNHGFIRIAAATPFIKIADCSHNRQQILEAMREAAAKGCELLVLPELCITGYTCGDLFRQQTLIAESEAALAWLEKESAAHNLAVVVGAPVKAAGRLFNCAVVLCRGKIQGVVPKTFLPNYSEFNEKRTFTSPLEHDAGDFVVLCGQSVPFGTRLLWRHTEKPDFTFAIEICEDIWSPIPPSSYHALAGATVIVNLSASNDTAGKAEYRRQLVTQQSARLLCAYAYTSAGDGESTTDLVFGGHDLIAENGCLLAESVLFENGLIYADIDTSLLAGERAKGTTFVNGYAGECLRPSAYRIIPFTLQETDCPLERDIPRRPFVPSGDVERRRRCLDILDMQTAGLTQRLRHTGIERVTLAISGGLDSTLALLVALRAFDQLHLDRKGICAISMPCFGTSARTRGNAAALAAATGVTFMELPIRDAVLQHFKDIGQDEDVYDLVYENAQARERTQVAMDIAAKQKGLMLGTGDLSEMALGFSTYNGDHMSMYNVNGSVPKTLIRPLIRVVAEEGLPEVRTVLMDIIATPISPELLPPDPQDGTPTQETEMIVGPYELHDFFLYHMLRRGASPEKIIYLAEKAFEGDYDQDIIKRWLILFYRRFFANQFKRSCMPDGPKVGSVCLSPRGDWRMPSDACVQAWVNALM